MPEKSKFHFRSLINRSSKDVFDWYHRKHMEYRCVPPGENMHVISHNGGIDQVGSRCCLKVRVLGLFWKKMEYTYTDYIPNESFTVQQDNDLYYKLKCTTSITAQSIHTTEILEQYELTFKLPKFLSSFIANSMAKRVSRFVTYKHRMIDSDLGIIEKYPYQKPLRILITGAHGLIGKKLCLFLGFLGHEVFSLSRNHAKKEENALLWDPQKGETDIEKLEGFDVVVNLAGENIGKGRWTQKKKEKILESRYQGTERLVELLKQLKSPPKTFINASAAGYYGNCGSAILDEESPAGKGLFVSEVCQHWERASRDLEDVGIRVAQARFGLVLTSEGGALKKMLRPFKWGLGGKIGSGRQYISWISMDDAVGALYHIIMNASLKGPVNITSPNPLPNGVFCRKLAKYLKRWVGPPVPEFLVRILLGQKGEELFLSSVRAEPSKLIKSGFTFQYPTLCQTLEQEL